MIKKENVFLILILSTFSISSSAELKCWAGDTLNFEASKFEITPTLSISSVDIFGKREEAEEMISPQPISYKNLDIYVIGDKINYPDREVITRIKMKIGKVKRVVEDIEMEKFRIKMFHDEAGIKLVCIL